MPTTFNTPKLYYADGRTPRTAIGVAVGVLPVSRSVLSLPACTCSHGSEVLIPLVA